MDGKQSLYLILLLLVALVFGPIMVMTQGHAKRQELPHLLAQQERIVDAPAPLSSSPLPSPAPFLRH